jgi:adenine phosphoribosyltransferase
MAATLRLVERLGASVVGAAFLIELAFLKGRARLTGHRIDSLIVYD